MQHKSENVLPEFPKHEHGKAKVATQSESLTTIFKVRKEFEDDSSGNEIYINKHENSLSPSQFNEELPKYVIDDIYERVFFTVHGKHTEKDTICSPIPPPTPPLTPKPSEEKHLVNWNTWLQRKEEQVKRIKKQTGKNDYEVLMNGYEDQRRIRERQQMIAYVQTLGRRNKLRGANAGFWKVGAQLNSDPLVLSTIPRAERHDKAYMDYVETPAQILNEKKIPVDRPISWLQAEYLKRKCVYHRPDFEYFEKFWPHTSEMAIIGEKKPLTDLDAQGKTYPEFKFYIEDYSCVPYEKTYECILEIEDEVFDVEDLKMQDVNFHLAFKTKTFEKAIQSISLRNIGVKAIDFEWIRDIDQYLDMPYKYDDNPPAFYFDKNIFRLIPGQKLEFKVFCSCREEGIYSEDWKLLTNPRFFYNECNIRLNLWVNCKTSQKDQDLCAIDKDLKERLIRREVDAIISKLKYVIKEPPEKFEYFNYFLDHDLFLFKNPQMNYRYANVQNLKDIYESIVPTAEPCWDYDIHQLRNSLLEVEETSIRRERYFRFQDEVNIIRHPKTYCGEHKEQKLVAVRSIISAMVDNFETDAVFLRTTIMQQMRDTEGYSEAIVTKRKTTSKFPQVPSTATVSTIGGGFERNPLATPLCSVQNRTPLLATSDYSMKVIPVTDFESKKEVMYLESLYIQTYQQLCITVEEVAGAIESFNMTF